MIRVVGMRMPQAFVNCDGFLIFRDLDCFLGHHFPTLCRGQVMTDRVIQPSNVGAP